MYKMRKILLFFTIISGQIIFASECFSEHLKEAIEQNRQRRGLYASISNNKSKSISNKLIFAEKIAHFYSKGLNKKLRPYREAGIPILCLDFIEMSKSPTYRGKQAPPTLMYNEVDSIGAKDLKKTLKEMLNEDRFHHITDFIEEELSNEIKYGPYNCLFKHVLESLGRTSYLTPYYIEHAKSVGLKSPQKLLKNYLKMNISALSFARYLDKKASSLQEKGIGILCRDVPHIPLRLDYEMELSKY